ncbi:unnamed protein product, partial [Rotaria socialis]
MLSCRDDDKDLPNREISVHPQWFPEGKIDAQNKYMIPFEIMITKSNITE